nr:sensor histidine kinase [Rubrivivax gelatinosus]
MSARSGDETPAAEPRPVWRRPGADGAAGLARLASFQVRVFLLLLCVSASLLFVVGYYVFERMHATLYENLGQHAVVQAQQIAAIPELIEAVRRRDLPVIERIAKTMLQRTDASFIVIGDANGLRLYHPTLDPGTPMVGDDNAPVLRDGQSEVTVRAGSLGYGLRGKAPIKDADGVVVGVVSVGYLQDLIFSRDVAQRGPVIVFLTIALGATFLTAWFFARSIKRQMLGMEPAEISRLVRQQEAVFDAIMEGVIAVDRHDRVRAINHAARDIVGDTRSSQEIIGCRLSDVVGSGAPSRGGDGTDGAPEIRDAVLLFNNVQVIANRLPVVVAGKPVGAVLSFRRKDDIATLSLQLSQVRRHADNLRVVRHEHMNWLSTISGLLEMRHYDEALQLARMQSRTQQRVLDTISQAFFNAPVCGMLLGKYYRARELGLELVIDPGCRLSSLPEVLKVSEWLSIIGNLLDNAYDAALALGERGQRVSFLMIESDDEIVIEVADTGVGVEAGVRETLFELGVSTKPGGEHGIGLHLVKTYVEQAAGTITIEDNEPRGTIFSLFIPKGAARAAQA